MTTYDNQWHEVTDTKRGTVETQEVELVATYEITDAGEGEYVTLKEYENGGKDVRWEWTKEPQGEWHFSTPGGEDWTNPPQPTAEEWWSTDGNEAYSCTVSYDLYTPYTDEEWQAFEEEREAREAQEQEAAEQAELVAALPDAVADLSEQVSTNALTNEEVMDALAELSQVVSDLVGGSNNG